MLAGTLLVTGAWAWVLLDRSPSWLPWLRVVIVLAAAAAAALILAGPALRAASRRGATALGVAAVSLALVAGLAGPLAYSIYTAATAQGGSIPTAGPTLTASADRPGGVGGPGDGRFGGEASQRGTGRAGSAPADSGQPDGAAFPGSADGSPSMRSRPGGAGSPAGTGATTSGGGAGVSRALSRLLESGASGYRWAAATVGSTSAASLELSSDGVPVMAIGGFTGTDPAPTLHEFERLVAEREIHYFVTTGGGAGGPGGGSGYAAQIASWVEAHFTAKTVGGTTVYDLSSAR